MCQRECGGVEWSVGAWSVSVHHHAASHTATTATGAMGSHSRSTEQDHGCPGPLPAPQNCLDAGFTPHPPCPAGLPATASQPDSPPSGVGSHVVTTRLTSSSSFTLLSQVWASLFNHICHVCLPSHERFACILHKVPDNLLRSQV